MSIIEKKSALRQCIFSKLKELSSQDIAEKSSAIALKLRSTSLYEQAQVIYSYLPMPFEVSLEELHKHALFSGKQLAFPLARKEGLVFSLATQESDFVSANLGFREPADFVLAPPADLILVPGLAFDSSCSRLGRGRGYYDRFLSNISAPCVGVAFDEQLVSQVPLEEHDVRVTHLITESGMFGGFS